MLEECTASDNIQIMMDLYRDEDDILGFILDSATHELETETDKHYLYEWMVIGHYNNK